MRWQVTCVLAAARVTVCVWRWVRRLWLHAEAQQLVVLVVVGGIRFLSRFLFLGGPVLGAGYSVCTVWVEEEGRRVTTRWEGGGQFTRASVILDILDMSVGKCVRAVSRPLVS